jgi:hypothetical protein
MTAFDVVSDHFLCPSQSQHAQSQSIADVRSLGATDVKTCGVLGSPGRDYT